MHNAKLNYEKIRLALDDVDNDNDDESMMMPPPGKSPYKRKQFHKENSHG